MKGAPGRKNDQVPGAGLQGVVVAIISDVAQGYVLPQLRVDAPLKAPWV